MAKTIRMRWMAPAFAAMAILSPISAQETAQAIAGDPVSVTGGFIAGQALANGMHAYLGVPFAAPPVNDLRWRPPAPVTPWTGVRKAVTLPPACMQTQPKGEAISEDCLYLNVWTPKGAHTGARIPVMVYIYGGGFSAGSASSPPSSGIGLASKGVIFVAGNYRVGPFGFMAHPDLDKENAAGASGDYGMLDQVAVLKWVQKNIARFGGDPGNVTLAGLSAGSVSSSAQHASPLSKGLFQKVMGISASSLTWEAGVFRSKAEAERDGLKVQQHLDGISLAEMRKLPAEKILTVRGGPPSVDGYFMPRDPKDIFASGGQNDVTTFVGFTRDEGYGPFMEVSSAEAYSTAAHTLYGDRAEKLLAAYPADDNWKRNARAASRDITLGMAMRRWAAGQVQPGRKPAFVYMTATIHHFAVSPAPESRNATAFHSSDNSFWLNDLDGFSQTDAPRAWTPADYALADKMSDMTVAFMKTGNPSIPGIVVPKYDTGGEQVIGIGINTPGVFEQMTYPGHNQVDMLGRLEPLARERR
jgi:para-nitrobenzyl esterase